MSEKEIVIEDASESAPVIEANVSGDSTQVVDAVSQSRPDTLDLVIDVPLRLTVELGTAQMLLREVLQLGKGAVVDLDRGANDPVDILVNGKIIARGDLTTADDRLAVRIIEMVQGDSQRGGHS